MRFHPRKFGSRSSILETKNEQFFGFERYIVKTYGVEEKEKHALTATVICFNENGLGERYGRVHEAHVSFKVTKSHRSEKVS